VFSVLVLGIFGILCGVPGRLPGYMGNKALDTINRGVGDPSERGNVVAGRICGIMELYF